MDAWIIILQPNDLWALYSPRKKTFLMSNETPEHIIFYLDTVWFQAPVNVQRWIQTAQELQVGRWAYVTTHYLKNPTQEKRDFIASLISTPPSVG